MCQDNQILIKVLFIFSSIATGIVKKSKYNDTSIGRILRQ